jgi:hypothetical protein
VNWPKLVLPASPEPWLGWEHSQWQVEWEAFRRDEGPLPISHVPTGLELESALRVESKRGNAKANEALALWLCLRGREVEALSWMKSAALPTSRRVAGLILWKKKKEPAAAVAHLEAGPLSDPIAVVELDQLYAELGLTDKRQKLLPRVPNHRFITERRAQLALEIGRPEETLRLLSQTTWPREHQRYVRTELWKQARSALGKPDADVPEALGEDNLARFGAYWS